MAYAPDALPGMDLLYDPARVLLEEPLRPQEAVAEDVEMRRELQKSSFWRRGLGLRRIPKPAQSSLGILVTLGGGLPVPFAGRSDRTGHPLAFFMHGAEVELRIRVPLLGGPRVPSDRLGVGLRDPPCRSGASSRGCTAPGRTPGLRPSCTKRPPRSRTAGPPCRPRT